MLLARIQRDLFDFTDRDPEDFGGLVEFWYRANSEALSAALSDHTGVNLILNVTSFRNFEALAKKVFLIADTLILRDTRDWASDNASYRSIPMPVDEYRPGYIPEVLDELQNLRPSPFTLLYRPKLAWTNKSKILNNGLKVAYAGWSYHSIPSEFLEWIGGPGREYMKTGQIIYAPFIPPLNMELEFLKHQVNLPEEFGSYSLFHERHEWLTDDRLQALLSLQVPFLDGIDITTISKVKEDNYDAFSAFSRTLLDSVNGIKSSVGTEGFAREVRSIQRNQIDAALNDVQKTFTRIEKSSVLRKMGILTGLIGLDAVAFMGVPVTTITTGVAVSAAAMIADRVAQLKDQGEISDKKGYFLWKLQAAQTKVQA
ncbi:protein of unknown function [Nitrospira defluvii]|jgi:hypothetical protein|uniref:Uncharacterized protein n=1 Tax=Nitrospira defluvii TaxID=330214 RepID=D8PHA9_9BACT|nr:protein of unknown function [Nitrospira defluvii]